MKLLLSVLAVGCTTAPVEQSRVLKMRVTPPAIQVPTVAPIEVVRFTRTTIVRAKPSDSATPLGVVAKGTRAAIHSSLTVDGCRWIEIEPRGWLCDRVVEATDDAPSKPAQIALDSDDPPPKLGVYGIVRGADAQAFTNRDDAEAGDNGRPLVGKNSVRATGSVTIDGKRYWRTSSGELIDASAIVGILPSCFGGVALADGDALPAWVRGTHELITITDSDAKRVHLDDGRYLARDRVRIATLTAPPPGTTAGEKWFDIDLDEQVLVAYEGERPVYATLVSTGKYKHETPTMIARIATKHERSTMSNAKGEVYSVADVPWTMFFSGDYALHTSYWHNGFGSVRSHGCVNLSPHDARVLYHWSSPDVPPGWTTIYGNGSAPGSLVRIHSKRNPEPTFRGYAADLLEDQPFTASITHSSPESASTNGSKTASSSQTARHVHSSVVATR